ncbi:CAAD domain-containing protein [Synechococcus sp. BIOS-U3-1]|uniref:CAAD domain-containing protein n=1 Tax=Synechococcus sp. BIOS-U3-1 TaxID=1400865 RepID=UPI001647755B|nr:CAAD domain-containing protein [Synechococcus sp. BIOS-U3-1]
MEAEDHGNELSVSHLIQQLLLGLESLKQLNLEGFKQIYPIFLIVFGSVILGLLLSFIATFLGSVNHLPIVGGLFQGVSELIGLVAVVRLITSNLLLQHRRAEVFARIAALKKDLLGGSE